MRLKRILMGTAGATGSVLKQFLQSGAGARVLVPTATLQQHLRNEVARSGVVLRARSVETLVKFAGEFAVGTKLVDDGLFSLLVEDAAKRLEREEFLTVSGLGGFYSSLARLLEELDTAGCAPGDLARARLQNNPLRDAVRAVWEDVDRELSARRLTTRAGLLRAAALGARRTGLSALWLDGFVEMSEPELRLVDALGRHVDMTITQCGEELREQLFRRGFVAERMGDSRAPEEVLVRAETAEREVEEVVRRIAEREAAGTPFREMGVVLRNPETYLGLFRTAMARFRVPGRFYFRGRLGEQGAVRFLAGAVECALGGWEHEAALNVLRMGPHSGELDRLEVSLRASLPGSGIEALRGWAGRSRPLSRVLDSFKELTEWAGVRLSPGEWAGRLASLSQAFWPGAVADGLGREQQEMYRSQAAALNAWVKTAEVAASWWVDAAGLIGLSAFWEPMRKLLELQNVDGRDGARNVVHVMSAHEARQWELSTLFVVGLVEKQFPKQNGRNPFLSEEALAALGVRTAAEKDLAEGALFEMVRTRARDLVVLSYPRIEAGGKPLLPSIFLDGMMASHIEGESVQPVLPVRVSAWGGRSGVHSGEMLAAAAARHQKVSVTKLEKLLQCSFQFFTVQTLGVREWPEAAGKRFNALVQGSIAHGVLKERELSAATVDRVFGEVYARIQEEKRFPDGFRAERLRRQITVALTRFVKSGVQFGGRVAETEWGFQLPLEEGLTMTGQIDRIDLLPDGRGVVLDYKFSPPTSTNKKVKDETKLQGPLYSTALEKVYGVTAAAMVYVSLRSEELHVAGWGRDVPGDLRPLTDEWMEDARLRVVQAMEQARSGVTMPKPADLEACKWCAARDACRVEEFVALPATGGQTA